jgi:hypothetical protein
MSRLKDAAKKLGQHIKKLAKHAVAGLTILIRAVLILALVLVAVLAVPYLAPLLGVPVGPVVRLTETILSWPVIALILGILVLTRHREAIEHVIRYGRVKLPGGVELQGQLPEKTAPNGEGDSEELVLPPDQQRALTDYIQGLAAQAEFSRADAELSRAEAEMSRARTEELQQDLYKAVFESVSWEFRYHDCFFVPTTKNALQWFALGPPQSRAVFDVMFVSQIPDRRQRDTVVNVLLQAGMIEPQAGKLGITKKGDAFLKFIGVHPSSPSPPVGVG